MKNFFKSYTHSGWIPICIFAINYAIFHVGMLVLTTDMGLIVNLIVTPILLIIIFISTGGILVASIVQFVSKRWKTAIVNLILFIGIVCFFFIF